MDIGKLRHKVTVETPTRVADADGGFTETWGVLGDAWASVEPATTERLERVVAGTVQATASHIVTMRYRTGVSTASRVVFNGRHLAVRGVQNPEERNVSLVLICEEVVT